MSREVQVRFCESREVRSLPATHLVILVAGTRSQTEALLPEVATVLSTVGLRLSVDKTLITHIDEASTSSVGASSGTRSGEPTGITSTTTRPRRPCGQSRPSARRFVG